MSLLKRIHICFFTTPILVDTYLYVFQSFYILSFLLSFLCYAVVISFSDLGRSLIIEVVLWPIDTHFQYLLKI